MMEGSLSLDLCGIRDLLALRSLCRHLPPGRILGISVHETVCELFLRSFNVKLSVTIRMHGGSYMLEEW
jgi:hypothetical protein